MQISWDAVFCVAPEYAIGFYIDLFNFTFYIAKDLNSVSLISFVHYVCFLIYISLLTSYR